MLKLLKEQPSRHRQSLETLKVSTQSIAIKQKANELIELIKKEEKISVSNPSSHKISELRSQMLRFKFKLAELETNQKATKKNKPKNWQRICFKRASEISRKQEQIKVVKAQLTELYKQDILIYSL